MVPCFPPKNNGLLFIVHSVVLVSSCSQNFSPQSNVLFHHFQPSFSGFIIIFRTTIAFQIHMPYLTNPKYQLFHASHLCFVSNNPVGNPSVEGPRGPQIQRSGPTTSCSSPRGPGIDVEPNVVSDEKHHDSRLLGLEFGV